MPVPPTPGPTPAAPSDRRQFWVAAAVMTGALVVLVGLFVAFYPRASEQGVSRQQQVDNALTQAPHIIPTPAEGRAPDNPGDPGGWEQLALLGAVVLGLTVVGVGIWRSSRKARAAQADRAARDRGTASSVPGPAAGSSSA